MSDVTSYMARPIPAQRSQVGADMVAPAHAQDRVMHPNGIIISHFARNSPSCAPMQCLAVISILCLPSNSPLHYCLALY